MSGHIIGEGAVRDDQCRSQMTDRTTRAALTARMNRPADASITPGTTQASTFGETPIAAGSTMATESTGTSIAGCIRKERATADL